MPAGPRGGKLDFDYLTRKAHNPGRRKKQREFYKNAKLIRSYEKLRKRDGDVGTERDFTKPQKCPTTVGAGMAPNSWMEWFWPLSP